LNAKSNKNTKHGVSKVLPTTLGVSATATYTSLPFPRKLRTKIQFVPEVEEIFETWPQQLHDHDVEVALGAAPLDLRNADPALHHPVELGLDVQLRVLGLDAFKFDGNWKQQQNNYNNCEKT